VVQINDCIKIVVYKDSSILVYENIQLVDIVVYYNKSIQICYCLNIFILKNDKYINFQDILNV